MVSSLYLPYLNFKQVFDTVDHSFLLEIFPSLGFHDSGYSILVSLADSSSSSGPFGFRADDEAGPVPGV